MKPETKWLKVTKPTDAKCKVTLINNKHEISFESGSLGTYAEVYFKVRQFNQNATNRQAITLVSYSAL